MTKGRLARARALAGLGGPAQRVLGIRRCCQTPAEAPHAEGCQRPLNMCGTKVGYISRQGAIDIARGMSSATTGELTSYWCPHCELWHVGHSPRIAS